MDNNPSHSDRGLQKVLTQPWVYSLFRMVIFRRHTTRRHVQEYIRPYEGCRILDVGCGPGTIIPYLPNSIGEYVGFDMNQKYIDSAKLRWRNNGKINFFCEKVKESTISQKSYYDIVVATGIIHHLDDEETLRLFDIGYHALKIGGRLITYDNVILENQHWIAKFMNAIDRGKAVRRVEGYKALASHCFTNIKVSLLHDTLRVPYSAIVMECQK